MRASDESCGAAGTDYKQDLEEDLFPHNSLSPILHQQFYAFELKYNIHCNFKIYTKHPHFQGQKIRTGIIVLTYGLC